MACTSELRRPTIGDERWNADDDGQQLCRPRLLRVLRVLLLNAQQPRQRGQKLDKELG